MSFFSKEPFYIGVEITSTSIKIAALERRKGGWKLLYVKELPLERLLVPLEKKGLVTTVLSQREVMVRSLQIELTKESDVLKALGFQIEPQLPFSLEEAILEAEVEKEGSKGYKATVFALKKEFFKKHVKNHGEYGVTPDAVTSRALALTSLLELEQKEDTGSKYLINVGEEETNVLLVKGDKLQDQRSFLTKKDDLVSLQRAILSLEADNPSCKSNLITLLGKESSHLAKSLQECTNKNVYTLDLQLLSLSSEELATFAVAIGAALSQSKKGALNFHQNEHGSLHPYKFIKKPLLLSSLLTFIAAVILYSGGSLYVKSKEDYLQKRLETLIEFRDEKSLSVKNIKGAGAFKRALSTFEESLIEAEGEYALEAQIPCSSDLLHWLSETIRESPPPLKDIQIDSFAYELVSRPTPLLKEERYKAQVELGFSANSPNVKEALLEFLVEASFIVDSEEPIEVSFFGGHGKAHFTLRDKTRYG